MISGCERQLRTAGLGKPFAFDFGAVMMVGMARGADAELIAELLPPLERIRIAGLDDDDDDGTEEA